MTPSIIRRFALYHGIDLADVHEDDVLVAGMRGIRTNSETQAEAHDRLIQSLTRIEDAESLSANANATTSVSDGIAFLHVRSTLDILADALLIKAGIVDTVKWREVKDE